MTFIDLLNRRLGESLGRVCGGTLPRFTWKYSPAMPYFVYDTDNRTLLRKCWADAPAPDGGHLGKVWVMAGWRSYDTFDHCGFGDGLRIPSVHAAGYSPYFETALAPGQEPTEEITANYIWALDQQLQRSVEHDKKAFETYMAEEKYSADRNETRNKTNWRESVAGQYDEHVGAFGNCEPGKRDGYLSFGGSD